MSFFGSTDTNSFELSASGICIITIRFSSPNTDGERNQTIGCFDKKIIGVTTTNTFSLPAYAM